MIALRRFAIALALAAGLAALTACDFGGPTGGGGTEGEGLTGVLVDADGMAAAGVMVRVYAATDSSAGLERRARANDDFYDLTYSAKALDSVRTDAQGRFNIKQFAPGTYNVAASYRRRDTTVAVFVRGLEYTGKRLNVGTDTLLPTGNALLQLRAGDDLLAGATCFIPGSPYRTTSNEDGLCLLENLAPGGFAVVVAYPGFNFAVADPTDVEPGLNAICGAVDILADGAQQNSRIPALKP